MRSIRRAIRGDLISDRSIPPGVYVKGFLSLVIIAFCTHAGGSFLRSPISLFSLAAGIFPDKIGGGGGGP